MSGVYRPGYWDVGYMPNTLRRSIARLNVFSAGVVVCLPVRSVLHTVGMAA